MMEVLVLGMVCASPWVFGAVSPGAMFLLYAGVALLLLLWAARMLLEGEWSWKRCPLDWCLAGLVLLSLVQLTPLPRFILGWLSPGTASLMQQLLPSEGEVLPDGAALLQDGEAAGDCISVYPGATRREAIKLLAVWLLFVVVRNNVASPAALARLCFAAFLNGTLLAIFALVQFFSSPPHQVYWSYPSLGRVFGPFVCANHFPFYVNMCIGLGIGLLLALRHIRRRLRRQRDDEELETGGWFGTLFKPLHDPAILWLSVGLALMMGSVFVSVSRGGVLALLLSSVICLGIKVFRSRRLTNFEMGMGILIVGAGLFTWFTLERVEKRLATIWTGTVLGEGRATSWRSVLPLFADFPLWGTGLGTYEFVEPLNHPPGGDPLQVWEHAHNDYLEALIEGGRGLSTGLAGAAAASAAAGRGPGPGGAVRVHHGGHSQHGRVWAAHPGDCRPGDGHLCQPGGPGQGAPPAKPPVQGRAAACARDRCGGRSGPGASGGRRPRAGGAGPSPLRRGEPGGAGRQLAHGCRPARNEYRPADPGAPAGVPGRGGAGDARRCGDPF
jgi:hypothetical protein